MQIAYEENNCHESCKTCSIFLLSSGERSLIFSLHSLKLKAAKFILPENIVTIRYMCMPIQTKNKLQQKKTARFRIRALVLLWYSI